MGRRRHCVPARAARGATLVELVVMIVVVGIAGAVLAGALGAFNRGSVDPVIRQQALAVAESMLSEILQQPTPDVDADGSVAEATGPETVSGVTESRGNAAYPFDHVNDYHGYSRTGIVALDGTPMAGLENYSISVSVRNQAVGNVPAGDGWWVEVTVRGPDANAVVLSGWRARLSG